MTTIQCVCDFLDQFAPPLLAESWDNVGLLAGDPQQSVRRLMTCLTITPASAQEAVEGQANLIVSHHPLPFRPLKRLVTDSTPGRLLWQLITHRVAIYSPHTAFDSTLEGINQRLAEALELVEIAPLVPVDDAPAGSGIGRCGALPRPLPLGDLADRLKDFLAIPRLQYVGPLNRPIGRVAVACGAAGQLLDAARRAACDLLVVGETNLHTCLEAEATNVALLLPGHFASERFAVERLAALLAERFADLTIWASRQETDPLEWY